MCKLAHNLPSKMGYFPSYTGIGTAMTITVCFFSSLREQLGKEKVEVDAQKVATVADLWQLMADSYSLTGKALAAVNQEHAGADQAIVDGDEVAFFPPVTGG